MFGVLCVSMDHQISYANISSERLLAEHIEEGEEEVTEASTPGQSIEQLLSTVPAEDPVIPPSDPFHIS